MPEIRVGQVVKRVGPSGSGESTIGTVVLALLVMLPPLRHATGFKPGEAPRYA